MIPIKQLLAEVSVAMARMITAERMLALHLANAKQNGAEVEITRAPDPDGGFAQILVRATKGEESEHLFFPSSVSEVTDTLALLNMALDRAEKKG